jgi:hypothetical protein
MIDHECKFASIIGKKPEWQTDEAGLTVCKYCHVPKVVVTTKTVRK